MVVIAVVAAAAVVVVVVVNTVILTSSCQRTLCKQACEKQPYNHAPIKSEEPEHLKQHHDAAVTFVDSVGFNVCRFW